MQMNQESSWLLDKAAKEDGAQVSVSGLIGDIEAMGTGLAGCKITGHTEPFKLHGIKMVSWPGYPAYPYYYDKWWDYGLYGMKSPEKPAADSAELTKAFQAAQEKAIQKKADEQAKQAINYLDPEVDKLEKKLKDIQSKIETAKEQRKRRDENKAKIAALHKQIEEAEKLLSKEMQY